MNRTVATVTGRARPMARAERAQRWYSISKAGQRPGQGPSYAEVYIYEEIDPWYGIGAQQLVDELRDLDVDEIDLHLNSPGGLVFDGIAIYQALVDHRATVTVYVDALAASIASVIAMAGDRIVMGRMAQLMIHDAWGLCVGDANDMRQMADELDRISDTIAIAYTRAGGTVKQWRKAMLAETWYSAEEAVAAGLADEVASKTGPEDGAPMALRRWNLADRGFRYPGREAAPAPQASDAGATPPAKDTPVDKTEPDIGKAEVAGLVDELAAAAAETTLALPDDFAALFAGAVADATKPPTIPISGQDIAALIAHEANHRPADPEVDVPDTSTPAIDTAIFATALKEGLQ